MKKSHPPRSPHSAATRAVALIIGLIKRPTAKSERYRRWIDIGWKPIPFRGESQLPEQRRFLLKLSIHRRAGAEVDAWADTGECGSAGAIFRPCMEVALSITFDPDDLPSCLHGVVAVLHQTVRHEIEHLMDEGFLALPGPPRRPRRGTTDQERWQRSVRLSHWYGLRRRLFASSAGSGRRWDRKERVITESARRGKCVDYMASAREIHAFTMGFQAEAKYRRVDWDVPMLEYTESMIDSERMTRQEADAVRTMLVRWVVAVMPSARISEDTIARYL